MNTNKMGEFFHLIGETKMLNEIKAIDKQYYMNTFGERLPVMFTHGEGMKLFSSEGKEYYDFLGGIAVTALGHSHPEFIKALKDQLDKLIHTSSLYYIENQARLAKKLAEKTCADRVFFANSGAEANEGAMKLAKIYFHKKGEERYEIISFNHSFHGRTLATVAATGQEKYQKPYYPLLPGVKQVEPNDIEAMKAAITPKTAAIMIELIQGEGGVHPMSKEYVKELRDLCDKKGILLIFDEVQTGMGRCGSLFCHQLYGVEPDIFTSAKALGNGIPIGAVCAKEEVAAAFAPGDHGTTFGGNPFATAAGLSVMDIMEKEKLIENSKTMGEYFKKQLSKVQDKYSDYVKEIRGEGLLIGIEMDEAVAKKVFDHMLENGFLTSLCGGKTMRIAPPLIITKNDINLFVSTFTTALKASI